MTILGRRLGDRSGVGLRSESGRWIGVWVGRRVGEGRILVNRFASWHARCFSPWGWRDPSRRRSQENNQHPANKMKKRVTVPPVHHGIIKALCGLGIASALGLAWLPEASAQGEAVEVEAEEVEMVAEAAEELEDEAATLSVEEAQEAYESFLATTEGARFVIDNLWILLAAVLVLMMHLGFSTLEAGLTRKKNTVNILFKNVFIIAVGILTYYLTGFNTHYPGEWLVPGLLSIGGVAGFPAEELVDNATNEYADYTYWSDFIFQAMFAATAATIVSGAVAERIKLSSFMIFSTLLVAFGYTIAGSWHWGGGFLAELGAALDADGEVLSAEALEAGEEADSYSMAFYDFAGSTVVHAFGGFAALACVILLGARKGKYVDGTIRPILGHSMPLATIGVFLLWLGWFGFNGGSVLSADPHLVSLVFVTTGLAAAAGAIGAMLTSSVVLKKPDLSMSLNGILAGLVGITAGADVISPPMAVVVGLVAGVIVVFSIIILDKIKIDDPVGAISVHGTCGIWGTLAVAFFGGASLVGQLIGIVAVCLFAFAFAFIVFLLLKVTIGVRVSEEEEQEGLDVAEHGVPAYSEA